MPEGLLKFAGKNLARHSGAGHESSSWRRRAARARHVKRRRESSNPRTDGWSTVQRLFLRDVLRADFRFVLRTGFFRAVIRPRVLPSRPIIDFMTA